MFQTQEVADAPDEPIRRVTARLDSAQPHAGLGYELDSTAAVVIGGTSLSGGRGGVLGAVLGCLRNQGDVAPERATTSGARNKSAGTGETRGDQCEANRVRRANPGGSAATLAEVQQDFSRRAE
jgi:hypothetical protein